MFSAGHNARRDDSDRNCKNLNGHGTSRLVDEPRTYWSKQNRGSFKATENTVEN